MEQWLAPEQAKAWEDSEAKQNFITSSAVSDHISILYTSQAPAQDTQMTWATRYSIFRSSMGVRPREGSSTATLSSLHADQRTHVMPT